MRTEMADGLRNGSLVISFIHVGRRIGIHTFRCVTQ